jgi:Tol biopolymer transport system component
VEELAMSPDLCRLAFVHQRMEANASDIWVCEIASRRFTKISTGDYYDEMPVWSPDSTRLAFYRTKSRIGHGWGDTTHPAYALSVWDQQTSQAREIAPPGQYDNCVHRPPVWSPDGSRILFNTAYELRKEYLGVYIVNAAGGTPRCLNEQNPDTMTESYGYHFSPDGKSVLFTWKRGAYMTGADGSGRRAFLSGQHFRDARWNSDGSRIILHGEDSNWFLATPDGSDLQPIIPPLGYRIVDVFTYRE